MSTDSATGTFKDWVACTTIAYCKSNGIGEFVTQSSGNTANALAVYSELHEISAHIFYLKENKAKIKPQYCRDRSFVKLHEVSSNEPEMKKLTKSYSDKYGVPWLPTLELQIVANSARADILVDVMKSHNLRFDWISQSLSSAFGPFGFYRGLSRLQINKSDGFRFLGVQQAAVCPFIKRFSPHLLESIDINAEKVIERTLFRSKPTEEPYYLMSSILNDYGGDFVLLTEELFNDLYQISVSILEESSIYLATDEDGSVFEKSGLILLIGKPLV